MHAKLFHDTACNLGEGPIWSGDQLFFFDINDHMLHALNGQAKLQSWELGQAGSAAAMLADGKLLIATDKALEVFDPADGARQHVIALEAGNPANRSNDGRADRQGGFWIGTMGKQVEHEAGAIYRFYRGELRLLFPNIGISNAICFAPDGRRAYFADTQKNTVYAVDLDTAGWPVGEPSVFHVPEIGAPDGAVVDADGGMILAIWGGSKAIRIAASGEVTHEIEIASSQVTCPAFGPDGQIFFTTARINQSDQALAKQPNSGGVFVCQAPVRGIEEPQVKL